jgi:hypothetical protein
MATPTQVGRSCISNNVGWQTGLTALTDIKGFSGTLANRLRGWSVHETPSGEREAARQSPTESKRLLRKARAAVFGNTSGPDWCRRAVESAETITDHRCVSNGNASAPFADDSRANLQRKLVPSRRQRENALGATDPNLCPTSDSAGAHGSSVGAAGVVAHEKTQVRCTR